MTRERLTSSVGLLAFLFALVTSWAAPAHAQETIEYYGTDHLGSVRVVFDPAGNLISRADYLPYGEEVFAPSGTMPAQQFTGQARDGEAGQDYFHARMYQPRTGRFNAVDPIFVGMGDPQQWNRYGYTRNNPLSLIDPSGMHFVVPGGVCSAEFQYCHDDDDSSGMAWFVPIGLPPFAGGGWQPPISQPPLVPPPPIPPPPTPPNPGEPPPVPPRPIPPRPGEIDIYSPSRCTNVFDRTAYNACMAFNMATPDGMTAYGACAVIAAKFFPAGLACAALVTRQLAKQCVTCATYCLEKGPDMKCLSQGPDEPTVNDPLVHKPGRTPQPPRPGRGSNRRR